MNNNIKVCSKCKLELELDNFYLCGKDKNAPYYKSECKKCSIERNLIYQKLHKKKKTLTKKQRDAAKTYYKQNKERWKLYRQRFLEKHPGYYKSYLQSGLGVRGYGKNKKNQKEA